MDEITPIEPVEEKHFTHMLSDLEEELIAKWKSLVIGAEDDAKEVLAWIASKL